MTNATQKSDNELLQEISSKISDLIAINAISGKERNQQIMQLVSLSYSNSDIARILGIPKGTVDSIRASFKKKK